MIAVDALFGPDSVQRRSADAAIMRAAREIGFFTITGPASQLPLGRAVRRELLRIFTLDTPAQRQLWRRKFNPANANVYRGWFPVQPGNVTFKEGLDIGPDIAYGETVTEPADPLREPTPLPCEGELPGWRAAARHYYLAMAALSGVLMRSIARGLALADAHFDAAFHQGLSTLRLLRYPPRASGDVRLPLVGAPHTDSGFVTLLAQDQVGGLQVRTAEGGWVDVPPAEGSLVVNFGQVLERWCAGRIRATEHRVMGAGVERHSIPFFYEARADAEIAPLPIAGAASFEPFLYGDFLWARIVEFVEFRGMQSLRPPRRPVRG